MNATLTLTARGETLSSTLTDAEAAAICDRFPLAHGSRGFARSLAADLRRWGSLFESKRFYLHKLAQEQLARENPEPVEQGSGELPRIAAFLTPVSNHLKSGARVTFASGPLTVVIKRAGERSRYPGHFHVEGISGFGDRPVYMGRISDKGHWFPSRECGTEVFALLDEFESNPAEYAAAYGRRSGRCCFCNLHLDDPISMGLGYGKVCSGHYSLTWGKRYLAKMVAERVQRQQEQPAEAVA
jgi:hypothetical protein